MILVCISNVRSADFDTLTEVNMKPIIKPQKGCQPTPHRVGEKAGDGVDTRDEVTER